MTKQEIDDTNALLAELDAEYEALVDDVADMDVPKVESKEITERLDEGLNLDVKGPPDVQEEEKVSITQLE